MLGLSDLLIWEEFALCSMGGRFEDFPASMARSFRVSVNSWCAVLALAAGPRAGAADGRDAGTL